MKDLKKEFIEYIKKEIASYERQWNDYIENFMEEENEIFRENVNKNLREDLEGLVYTCIDRGIPEKEVKSLFTEEGYEFTCLKVLNRLY